MYKYQQSFSNKKFFAIIVALIITVLIDTSVVKINDLVDKYFISLRLKSILFAINTSLCLLLQFAIIRYVTISFSGGRLNKSIKVKVFYGMSRGLLIALGSLLACLIFQIFYFNYYDTYLSIAVITISYGVAAAFAITLSLLFLSWYKSKHDLIVLLYFISTLIIGVNLVTTMVLTDAKVNGRPARAIEYVGSSGDVLGAKYPFLADISKITSFMSFFSIWITTVIMMQSYREKRINSIIFMLLLSLPLVYFIITYFYQYILGTLLGTYIEADPVTVLIIIGTFLSLSKPIGGLVFGIAFWKISRIVSYERNFRMSLLIAGWGILLIFTANQGATQIVGPYPPFGLATITVLNLAGYLMLLGIYNSASLVSVNNTLRGFIHARALKLLNSIGEAEMEKDIINAVEKISQRREIITLSTESKLEFDKSELNKYLHQVIREVKKRP